MSQSLGAPAAADGRRARAPVPSPGLGQLQRGGEPGAAQVELAVGASQVHLDGLGREVERMGDLAAGGAARGDLGHAPPAAASASAPAPAGGRGGRPPAAAPLARARTARWRGRHGPCRARRGGSRARRGAPRGAPARAELGQAARELEPGVAGREVRAGLLQQRDRLLARRDQRAHPGGVAERARRAPADGQTGVSLRFAHRFVATAARTSASASRGRQGGSTRWWK